MAITPEQIKAVARAILDFEQAGRAIQNGAQSLYVAGFDVSEIDPSGIHKLIDAARSMLIQGAQGQ
jgi:arginase family enzyme